MDILHRARLVWGQLRQLARIEAGQDEWRLFLKLGPDGAAMMTLVNFRDGVHRRIVGTLLTDAAMQFLATHRVQLGTVRLASVVGQADESAHPDWASHRPGPL